MIWDGWTFASLQGLLKDNQFLVGGIGTVAFSGLIYQIRSLPHKIGNALYKWSTITVELNTLLYNTTDFYVLLSHLEQGTVRRFEKNYSFRYRALIPGYGKAWARCDGLWVRYERVEMNKGYQYGDGLNLVFWTRSRKRVEDWIYSILPPENTEPRLVLINHGNRLERPLRPWSSVFAPEDVKETLRRKFLWFAQNEAWYIEHGLPYKFCVLVEGEPGVGKSSLITAFASEFGLECEYVANFYSMEKNIRDRSDAPATLGENPAPQKVRTLAHLSFQRAIILEDVEALAELNRESKDYKAADDGMAVQELLNLMDSGTTPWGLILFLTTNHPDRLDVALRRPGRIDCTIRLTKLNVQDAGQMFMSFYGPNTQAAWDAFSAQHYQPVSGAVLQQAFYRTSWAEALEDLKTLIPESLNANKKDA